MMVRPSASGSKSIIPKEEARNFVRRTATHKNQMEAGGKNSLGATVGGSDAGSDVESALGGGLEKGEKPGDRITFLEAAGMSTYLLFLMVVFVGAVPVMEKVFLELGFMYYQPLVPFILMLWLWGVNTWVWTNMKVDYACIFDLEDSSVHLSPHNILRAAGLMTAFVLTSAAVFAYTAAQRLDSVAAAQPVILYMSIPLLFLLPVSAMWGSTRRFFFSTLLRVLVPVGEVHFADFLLADVLTSLSKTSSDVERALCHMTTGDVLEPLTAEEDRRCGSVSWHIPLALAWPYMIRLVQCLRVFRDHGGRGNLGNALKYSTAFPVIVLSAAKYHVPIDLWRSVYKPWWLACAFVNSAFSFYWDLDRDWDLTCFQGLSTFRGKHPGLKADLMYGRGWMYYGAAAVNLLLRISWTYKLSAHLRHNHYTVFGVVVLEVLRRFQWMFFRVETELGKIHAGKRQLKYHGGRDTD